MPSALTLSAVYVLAAMTNVQSALAPNTGMIARSLYSSENPSTHPSVPAKKSNKSSSKKSSGHSTGYNTGNKPKSGYKTGSRKSSETHSSRSSGSPKTSSSQSKKSSKTSGSSKKSGGIYHNTHSYDSNPEVAPPVPNDDGKYTEKEDTTQSPSTIENPATPSDAIYSSADVVVPLSIIGLFGILFL